MWAILHIKAMRVSMVSKWHQIWSRSGGDWIAWQLADGTLHRLQGTSSWKKHLNWHHGNICGQRTKSETCLEALRMFQDDQSHVSLWLFVAMQLVGKRQRFGWTWLGENHRGVEPSDQTGGRFKWLWWLLNYNLGWQGARALGESLAKFQHFPLHLFWSWFQQSWLTRCQSLGSVTGPATGSTLRILWAKIVGIQIIMKD